VLRKSTHSLNALHFLSCSYLTSLALPPAIPNAARPIPNTGKYPAATPTPISPPPKPPASILAADCPCIAEGLSVHPVLLSALSQWTLSGGGIIVAQPVLNKISVAPIVIFIILYFILRTFT